MTETCWVLPKFISALYVVSFMIENENETKWRMVPRSPLAVTLPVQQMALESPRPKRRQGLVGIQRKENPIPVHGSFSVGVYI